MKQSGRLRFPTVAAAALPLLVSACSTFEGDDPAAMAVLESEKASAELRVAELENELAALRAENAALQKDLAAAETAPVASNEPESDETEQQAAVAAAPPQVVAQPPQAPVETRTVIAAADANTALRDAPEKPVQTAPRLVQPTFASDQETNFENEASETMQMESVLFGVHLASYRNVEDARAGWKKLQQENPDELGLLEPRLEAATIEGRGEFLRLIGGALSSDERAQALCAKLKSRGAFCAVTHFEGERLALSDQKS